MQCRQDVQPTCFDQRSGLRHYRAQLVFVLLAHGVHDVCFCRMGIAEPQQALQVLVEGPNPRDRSYLGQLPQIGAGDFLHHRRPVSLGVVRSPLVSFGHEEVDTVIDLRVRDVRKVFL